MTELALRSATEPLSEAEAWTALLGHTEALDKVRHPKDLKDEMYAYLARRWDMSESKLDFADFGILWIDAHYRNLTTKMAAIGPGRETFSIATYRILKTARLEGYWDTILENLADWIKRFAPGNEWRVSITDFERLLDTMPASRELGIYKSNLSVLFWGQEGPGSGHKRTTGLLSQLSNAAYEHAHSTLLRDPPGEGWELRELMYHIQHRGIMCKSVMLHICLWFNPLLEEPANRTNNKHPMFHHLKFTFCKYDAGHPAYESDETWKVPARDLQRVVLDYTLEQWPKGNQIIGKLGTLQNLSIEEYAAYVSAPFWDGLIREVRKNTDVPFRHLALQKFNIAPRGVQDAHGPPPTTSWTAVPRNSAILDQVQSIIRDEYSDHTPGLSAEDDSTDDGVEYKRGRGGPTRQRRQSDEFDYIVVGDNALTTSSQRKKRKAQAMKQESEENDLSSTQNKRRTPSTGTFERLQPQDLGKSRASSHRSSLPLPMPQDHIPMNTIVSSARAALASMQSSSYSEPKHSGLTATPVLPSQPHEQISWDSNDYEITPARRLRKHNITTPASHQSLPQLAAQPEAEPQLEPARPSQPPTEALQMTPQPMESPMPQGHGINGKIEQAVLLLQDQYGDKLQIKEMLAAIKLLKNEVDATIFLTLKPGRLRNAWLQNEIKGC